MASPNVNRPTNVKEKEADINRKLQVYGIFRAFKAGKVPSVRHHRTTTLFLGSIANQSHRTTKLMSP